MKILKSVGELQSWRSRVSSDLGFVPTMGALHRGHEELVNASLKSRSLTVVSVFVNPAQFNDKDDFGSYPVHLDEDLNKLESLGVDAVFIPTSSEMYPNGYTYKIGESDLSRSLCGKDRPGHFDGVLTVVLKLFNLIKPSHSYFGEKDYQQLSLVKGMVEEFYLPIQIVPVKTVRENDGLAMSSRNLNLTPVHRELAPMLFQNISSHEKDEVVIRNLEKAGFQVDYVETRNGRRYAAAKLGNVRLIDNVQL